MSLSTLRAPVGAGVVAGSDTQHVTLLGLLRSVRCEAGRRSEASAASQTWWHDRGPPGAGDRRRDDAEAAPVAGAGGPPGRQ